MQGANLIYGGRFEDRILFVNKELSYLNFNQENNPDFLLIEPREDRKSIGIEDAKKIKEFLQEKPFLSKYKVVLVPKAELLTTEAQNSLLKILEEPPVFSVILLCAKSESSVLPTILSRCKRHLVKSVDHNLSTDTKDVSTLSNADKLLYAEELSKLEKDQIIVALENIIELIHANMLNKEKNAVMYAKNIEKVHKTINDLENTTVPSKLALEQLFFML